MLHQGYILFDGSRNVCRLYALPSAQASRRDAVLDSKFFTKAEVDSLLSETLDEIEFDSYIVTVEYAPEELSTGLSCGPPRVKRFKPPSQSVLPGAFTSAGLPPAPVVSCDRQCNVGSAGHSGTTAAYQISHAELDDIWSLGDDNSTSLPTAHTPITKVHGDTHYKYETNQLSYKSNEDATSVFSDSFKVCGPLCSNYKDTISPSKNSQSWDSCDDSDIPLANLCDGILQCEATDENNTNSRSRAKIPIAQKYSSLDGDNRTQFMDDEW